MYMIETHQLKKSFKSKGGVLEVVKGLDLRVEQGQIYGFLGPNGAGKTTTLRMLTTLTRPTAGEARVAGFDLATQPGEVRERIGYVSQAGGADQTANARENLMLQARLYSIDKAEASARAGKLIEMLELQTVGNRRVATYSGGQRRRLDIGLGLIHRPALLFLDEPTTGLDPQSRARLWDEVRRLRETGTTVFLTTHYLDEADALCDQLAIIDDGAIVVSGTPDSLKREIAGDIVTIGFDSSNGAVDAASRLLKSESFVRDLEPGAEGLRVFVDRGEEALPSVLRVIDGAGLRLQTISLARPSLDDVFLRQTGRSLREAHL